MSAMRAPPRVYLAGPDVFLPDAPARGHALKAICRGHGLCGVFPLDTPSPAPPDGRTPDGAARDGGALVPGWHRIARANEAHIRGADALIANLTPFRGPSADVGTVFEVGFMRALGRPVFAWSASGETLRARSGGGARDADGLTIEDFGLAENLMIPAAIADSGGRLHAAPLADPWSDLSLFEACVRDAARLLLAPRAGHRGRACGAP